VSLNTARVTVSGQD